MTVLRSVSLLVVPLGLAACQESTPAPETTGFSPAACLAEGGRPGRGGLLNQQVCFLPHADAGASCRKATDCTGMCLVGETGATCSAQSPVFGCVDFLDEAGQRLGICID